MGWRRLGFAVGFDGERGGGPGRARRRLGVQEEAGLGASRRGGRAPEAIGELVAAIGMVDASLGSLGAGERATTGGAGTVLLLERNFGKIWQVPKG